MTVFQQGEGEDAPRNVRVMIISEGDGGKPVMVMFMGPEAEVTQEYVQASLDTVK